MKYIQYNLDDNKHMFKINLTPFVDLYQVRSDEARERCIDRLVKKERVSCPFHYSLILKGISKFCFTGFDPDVLVALRADVIDYKPKSGFMVDDQANSLMAVELLQSMPFPAFPGVTFEKGVTIDLPFGGIILHVVTDAVLSWIDASGVRHVGAVKVKVRKSDYPRESAEMVACLLAKAMMEKCPDAIVDPQLSICLDVFRQRLVVANNLSLNLDKALEIAALIATRGDLAA